MEKTGFSTGFPKYVLFRFAVLLGLFLKPLGLGAEFNSASNGAIFTRVIDQKVPVIRKIQVFQGGF